MRRLKRIKWKNIISAVLVGVLLIGAVAGLGSIFGKDTKTISPGAFSVGAINAQGNYEKSDVSIYTKDMFECQGLSIEPDFEATGTYKVFYYDSNKNFISATDELNAEDGVYTKGITSPLARYARVMITPDVPTDEDGKKVEDFKIRFYEVMNYANEYNITVNKKQDFNEVTANLWKESATMGSDNFYAITEGVASTEYSTTAAATFCNSELVDVTGYDKLVIIADFDTLQGVNFHSWNASKNLVEYIPLDLDTEGVDISVSDNVATIVIELGPNVNYVSFSLKQITGVAHNAIEVYAMK